MLTKTRIFDGISKSGWRILGLLLISCSFLPHLGAQSKVFFDKLGKSTDEGSAYYYRQKTGEPDSYKSYYINGGALYFDGKISNASNADETENTYAETCNWFYKNGNKKAIRTFDKGGLETGTSNFYYETGKLWKEIDFVNGKAKTTYKEYDEDGKSSRIFEDDFNDNANDWDLYISDKSSAALRMGNLQISSYSELGAVRYISHPIDAQDYVIEAVLNTLRLADGDKAGIVFGFKDWQNYNFFLITASSFYIGTVYEGISVMKAEGMYTGDIVRGSQNNLKILTNGEKDFFSINGSVQFSCDRLRMAGSNIGFGVSGKSTIEAEKLIVKEIDFRSGSAKRSEADHDVKATGSGLIISSSGYILTNYHVVKTATNIVIQVNNGGTVKNYNAILIQKDVDNDLAILKIKDEAYQPLEALQYRFKESGGVEVGASVFTIGYPYALSGMGVEAKFTDGKISAKTGYNDAINSCQTSIPVQPGNSGGPLFNEKGELIGVINSKITQADNVSYAIKLSYVKNLTELLPDNFELPANPSLGGVTLEEKIKVLSNYVVLIKIK
jgi:S1-C subfamily serine protease